MLMDGSNEEYEEVGVNPAYIELERELLHALLQATDYGVLVSGLDRQDIIANRKLTQLFGLSAAQVVQMDPDKVRQWALGRARDRARFLSLLECAYADPYLTAVDEVELKGEPLIILRRYTCPITGKSGEPVARLWTFLDITENRIMQRQVQDALNDTKVELNVAHQRMVELEKLSTAGLIAAGIAHDIRNILSAMKLAMASLPQSSTEVLDEHFDRFTTLTQRLLAYCSPTVLETRPVALEALCLRVANLIRVQAELYDVQVFVQCEANMPMALADAGRLEQMLVNLCLNAIQAMDSKGGTLNIGVSTAVGMLMITVADTGHGMPEETVQRIFEPFFTTKANGFGLGLYNCKRIAEEHGGDIAVNSASGHGTTFTVTIPAVINCDGNE